MYSVVFQLLLMPKWTHRSEFSAGDLDHNNHHALVNDTVILMEKWITIQVLDV